MVLILRLPVAYQNSSNLLREMDVMQKSFQASAAQRSRNLCAAQDAPVARHQANPVTSQDAPWMSTQIAVENYATWPWGSNYTFRTMVLTSNEEKTAVQVRAAARVLATEGLLRATKEMEQLRRREELAINFDKHLGWATSNLAAEHSPCHHSNHLPSNNHLRNNNP